MDNKITVSDVKKHLNIEEAFIEDDNYIETLIQVAEKQVTLHLNGNSLYDEEGNMHVHLRQAILLLIGTLYNNRESASFSSIRPVAHAYEYLLQLSKSYDYDFSE